MLNKKAKEIAKFLKDAINHFEASKDHEGCYFKKLDSTGLYIVAGYDDENDLCCKIAFNCNCMQCDYEWDWEMPRDSKGIAYHTDSIIYADEIKQQAKFFAKSYKEIYKIYISGGFIEEVE